MPSWGAGEVFLTPQEQNKLRTMHRRNFCRFQWVYLFGTNLVAYKPGQVTLATLQDNEPRLRRCTGTCGIAAACLRAFLQGVTCHVHQSYASVSPVKGVGEDTTDTASTQAQMVDMVAQPFADSQNVALQVLGTLELSALTEHALVKHLLTCWLEKRHVNVNLLYFVQTLVQDKHGWLNAFIDTWARAAQTCVCAKCGDRGVACHTVYSARSPAEHPGPVSKLVLQVPVTLRCNMCSAATRTTINVSSFRRHHWTSPRPTPVCMTTRHRKPFVRRRPRLLVAALS